MDYRSIALNMIAVACLTVLLAMPSMAGSTDRGLAEFQQARFAEALQLWQEAAGAGDARGALYVGVLYDTGLGVTQSYQQAMTWYRRAADAGSAIGAFNIGVLYDAGLGVEKDARAAAIWYQRAAARGFGRAQYNLGMLYEGGVGVARSRDRAIALYKDAARHGITAARDHLALLGIRAASGVPTQHDAAMQDFQQAQTVLLSRGPAEAAQVAALFRRAAEQHNALAEYDLGYCYDHGVGVARDPGEAYRWYRRAAQDAPSDALRTLADQSAGSVQPPASASTRAE